MSMVGQAERLGIATLTRLAEVMHTGLVDMRGTTSPRLVLELLCSRMLLPGASTGDAALLQRLERMERRMEIAGITVRSSGAVLDQAQSRRDGRPRGSPMSPSPAPGPRGRRDARSAGRPARNRRAGRPPGRRPECGAPARPEFRTVNTRIPRPSSPSRRPRTRRSGRSGRAEPRPAGRPPGLELGRPKRQPGQGGSAKSADAGRDEYGARRHRPRPLRAAPEPRPDDRRRDAAGARRRSPGSRR